MKSVGHTYLEPKNTWLQLFRAQKIWVAALYSWKILGYIYLEPDIPWSQLFKVQKAWGTKNLGHSYLKPEVVGHSYLEQENTGL